MSSTPSGYRASNSTAEKALRVMALFSPYRRTLTAIVVADELNVARSTAYRYLESLESHGFLHSGPGGFAIGPRIQELAEIARHDDSLRELAIPLLIELRDRFGETAILTHRNDITTSVIEEVISCQQITRVYYDRGSIMPIQAGAPSLVLLHGASDEELAEVYSATLGERFTKRSIQSLDELIAAVRQIEQTGYAVTHGQLNPDAVSVAVPILAKSGQPLGSLGICPVASRFTAAAEAEMVETLQESTAALTRNLR